jgi:hypothetical protein
MDKVQRPSNFKWYTKLSDFLKVLPRYYPRIPLEGLRNTAKSFRLHGVPVEIPMGDFSNAGPECDYKKTLIKKGSRMKTSS